MKSHFDILFDSIINSPNAENENTVKYSDCVDAVLESDVLGSTAERILDMIPIGNYPDLYEAVINVMKANHLGSTKERMIKNMIVKTKGGR